MIGDMISLQYQNKRVKGSDFGYDVGIQSLSFGTIIALAGDFYSEWEIDHCPESISDYWDSDRTRSIETAKRNADLLRGDKPNTLHCLLPLIKEQKDIALKALHDGSDPAQVDSHIPRPRRR